MGRIDRLQREQGAGRPLGVAARVLAGAWPAGAWRRPATSRWLICSTSSRSWSSRSMRRNRRSSSSARRSSASSLSAWMAGHRGPGADPVGEAGLGVVDARARSGARSAGRSSPVRAAGDVVDGRVARAQGARGARRPGPAATTGRRPGRSRASRSARAAAARAATGPRSRGRRRRPRAAARRGRRRRARRSRRRRAPARGRRSGSRPGRARPAGRRRGRTRRAIRPAPTTRTRRPSSGPVTGTIRSSATSASDRGGPSRHERVSRPRWSATWNSRSSSGLEPGRARARGADVDRAAWRPRAAGGPRRHSRSWWRIWSSPTTTLSRPAATREQVARGLGALEAPAALRQLRQRRAGRARATASPVRYSSTRWQVRSRIARGSWATAAAASPNASRASLGTSRAWATSATRRRSGGRSAGSRPPCSCRKS